MAVEFTFQPTKAKRESINKALHTKLGESFTFTVSHNYRNDRSICVGADEAPVMEAIAKTPGLSSDAVHALSSSASIRAAYTSLGQINLTDVDTQFAEGLNKRIDASPWKDSPITHYEVWQKLSPMLPKFLYFSNYDLLPGKINLADLRSRLATVKSNPTKKALIEPKHLSILALLRIAGLDLDDFDGNLRSLHLKFRCKPWYTEEEYAALTKVGRHIATGGWLSKVFLKAMGVSLLMVSVALLTPWFS